MFFDQRDQDSSILARRPRARAFPWYRAVGTAAARKLVESMGGWWQLMMHPKNKPSHEFWKRTFDYPGVQFVSTRRGPVWYDGDLRGTVMTFKVKKK